MSDALRPPSVEALLAETPWVEALARRLVADDATADDVVQETWLAAIESPPRDASALRGWLSRVVRNAAFQSRRRESRRARWESAVPSPPPAPSPEETVARAESHRMVVVAVMSLDEPYRTAVLLRFFEGLESFEVARRTGVPVETARTQIKRALALLRGRLDRDHGGDGRAWAVALVPLAGGRDEILVTATKGGTAMAAATKTVAAAAAVGALVGSLITAGAMATSAPPAVGETPRETASMVRGSARSGATSTEVTDASQDAPNPRDRVPLSPSTVAPPERSALTTVIDAVRVDVPAAATGAITGHVSAKDGSPVAGVTVRAWTPRTRGPSRNAAEATAATEVEQAAVDAIADVKWRNATQREARTDDSGAFRLTGVLDAKYRLSVSASGWSVRAATGSDASDVGPGSDVDFVATAVVEVPVTVVSAGEPLPERVLVRWAEPGRGGGSSSWWTSADPVVRVEPGTWALAAEIGNDARSEPVTVHAASGQPLGSVTLRLAQRNVVSGVVRFDAADSGWDYVHLTARRRPSGGRDDTKGGSARPPDWSFRFEDLEPGEYDVSAGLDSRVPLASVAVRVTSGRVTQDLVIPRIGPEHFVTVRAFGPDDAPLPPNDLQLSLAGRGDNGVMSSGGKAVPQSDGSLRLLLGSIKRDNSSLAARWSVVARSKRFGTKEVEFDHGRTESVEFRFGEAAIFKPTIVGADDATLASRLRVTLAPAGQAQSFFEATRGVEEPVEPGSYDALLWLAGGDGCGARLLTRVRVQLQAGANAATLRVPELTTLTVRCPEVADGTQVFLAGARRPDAALYSTSKPLADGIVSFAELPPGLYLVQMRMQGERRDMVLRLPGPAEVAFEPTEIAGLVVTVDDPSGTLGSAGFQSGDLIVAMDGVPLDTMHRADALLDGARGRASIGLEILRGGRRVALSVDPSKLGPRTERGGAWEPVLR